MLNLYLLGPQAFCFFNLLFSKNKTAIYLVSWHHSMIINFRVGSAFTTTTADTEIPSNTVLSWKYARCIIWQYINCVSQH